MKSRLFGDYLMSMPFVNYGGPVGSPEACRLLVEEAIRLSGEMDVDLLELRSREALGLDLRASRQKVTVLLPLPEDPQLLWKEGLRSKVRSQIRRPMKAGMTTQFGVEHLPAFYRVFSRNMRDLGTPVLPPHFFDAIRHVFSDQFVVCAIYHGNTPVAAGCGLCYGGEFELTWASSLQKYNREAPNMLLYWSLMEEMIRRGVHTFNFGRCTPGEGTHRFKLQWGGVDVPLHWTQWSPTGVADTPSPEKGMYKTAVALWRRLPVPVANAIGPFITRSLPSW